MSRNTWIVSAIFVVVFGIYVGSVVSETTLLDFLAASEPTQQVETVEESPWKQEGEFLTTQVTYSSPAGNEANVISIKLDDNKTISEFDMTIETQNETSIAYQEEFIEELGATIIGMKPEDVADIDTIAGASLTTKAFTDAISKI